MSTVQRLDPPTAVSKLEELPPISDVVLRLSDALEDPKTHAGTLAKLVESDPPLASRVLKIANSAYYAVPGGVASLQRAITFIGFSAVHNVALSLCSLAILDQRQSAPVELRAHSSATAALARHLARTHRVAAPDLAYAGGLLHDIGWFALQALFPSHFQEYVAAVRGGAIASTELELERLGITHAELGEALARRWKYPANLLELIASHHRPRANDAKPTLLDVVATADAWCSSLGFSALGANGPALEQPAFRGQVMGLAEVPPDGERPALLALLNEAASV